MEATKRFNLDDVLSASTGCLVTARHMEGIYDILNWVTDDNLFTHQLPRAFEECRPWFHRWFPKLKDVDTDALVSLLEAKGKSLEVAGEWVQAEAARLGLDAAYDVPRIPQDDHERKDPIDELVEMRGSTDGIVAVVVEPDADGLAE